MQRNSGLQEKIILGPSVILNKKMSSKIVGWQRKFYKFIPLKRYFRHNSTVEIQNIVESKLIRSRLSIIHTAWFFAMDVSVEVFPIKLLPRKIVRTYLWLKKDISKKNRKIWKRSWRENEQVFVYHKSVHISSYN